MPMTEEQQMKANVASVLVFGTWAQREADPVAKEAAKQLYEVSKTALVDGLVRQHMSKGE